MPRLFTGIEIPDEIREEIARLGGLGGIPEALLEELTRAI